MLFCHYESGDKRFAEAVTLDAIDVLNQFHLHGIMENPVVSGVILRVEHCSARVQTVAYEG